MIEEQKLALYEFSRIVKLDLLLPKYELIFSGENSTHTGYIDECVLEIGEQTKDNLIECQELILTYGRELWQIEQAKYDEKWNEIIKKDNRKEIDKDASIYAKAVLKAFFNVNYIFDDEFENDKEIQKKIDMLTKEYVKKLEFIKNMESIEENEEFYENFMKMIKGDLSDDVFQKKIALVYKEDNNEIV